MQYSDTPVAVMPQICFWVGEEIDIIVPARLKKGLYYFKCKALDCDRVRFSLREPLELEDWVNHLSCKAEELHCMCRISLAKAYA